MREGVHRAENLATVNGVVIDRTFAETIMLRGTSGRARVQAIAAAQAILGKDRLLPTSLMR